MSEDAAPKKKSKPKRDAAGNDVPKKKSKPKRDAAIEDAPALSAVDAPKAKKKKKNQEEGQGDPVAAETETVPKKKSKKRDAQEAPVDMETETLANEERGDGNIAVADAGKPARVRKRKRPKPAPAAANSEPVQAGADSQPELGRQTHARAPTSSSSTEPTTLYVEGISYDAKEDDVQRAFEQCGVVVAVRMPRYQDSGRPRGYAHVVFETAASATAALTQMAGHQLMGRYLTVARPNTPRALGSSGGETAHRALPPGCKTVFVRNLPYDCSEDAVRQTFSACGRVSDVRLALWNHTKLRKGFGYVEFVKDTSAEVAVNKRGLMVGGRPVACDYETAEPKGSFRRGSGQHWTKTPQAKGGTGNGSAPQRPGTRV